MSHDVKRIRLQVYDFSLASTGGPSAGTTEVQVQGISSVGYAGGEGSKPRLWNLQNLCPVPRYSAL